jgi:hypothetical protein
MPFSSMEFWNDRNMRKSMSFGYESMWGIDDIDDYRSSNELKPFQHKQYAFIHNALFYGIFN